MTLRPAIPYDSARANAKARTLNPAAFVRFARDATRAHRFQVLLQGDGVAYLVASGKSWVDALASYLTWHMEHSNGEAKAD